MAVTYTLGQLTDDVFRQLRGSTRVEINALATDIDAPAALTQETIGFTGDLGGIVVGALLIVGDETMYVLDAFENTASALVLRGYDDTTPVVAGAGNLVTVDPPWTRGIVQDRIKDEIRSWPPQVFAVASVDIPVINWQRGYDLGDSVGDIIRILYVTTPLPYFAGLPGNWWVGGTSDITQQNPSQPFFYDPNANPTEFPSGKSITLIGPNIPTTPFNIHIVYATTFDVDTSWDDDTDMVADVGLDERMLDIPPFGTTARLIRMLAVRRTMLNVQGQSEDAQDVSMATILQSAQVFENTAKSRLSDMEQSLLSDWPFRSTNY